MTNNLIYIGILFGVLMGMYGMCAFSFLTSREKQKPYREAFGWLALIGVMELIADYIMEYHLGMGDDEPLYIAKDMLSLPFFVMEGTALLYQDVELLPWRRRWMHLLLQETPFVVLLGILVVTGEEWVYYAMSVYGIGYISYMYFIFFARLYNYNKEIHKLGKETSLTWIYIVFSLNLLQWILYSVVATLGFALRYDLYVIITVTAWLFHAYYLNKQTRIDFERTLGEKVIAPMEVHDMRSTEGIRSNEEKRRRLLQKKSANDTLDLFLLDYPRFRQNLERHALAKITRKDLTLATLICEGRKTSEIAEVLCIGAKSVEVARCRLRSKLQVAKGEQLKAFLVRNLM